MIAWLLGALGGILIVAVPAVCYRILNESELTRLLTGVIAFSALVGIILALLLASQQWLAAIIFALLSGGAWFWWSQSHRHDGVDFVVEEPLLGESIAPELIAQLAAAEAEVEQDDPQGQGAKTPNPGD